MESVWPFPEGQAAASPKKIHRENTPLRVHGSPSCREPLEKGNELEALRMVYDGGVCVEKVWQSEVEGVL
jgi:hypothetical protein